MSEQEIVNIFTQLCLAINHAHGYGILHRDIKADNVLLNENQFVKLADFGVSKILVGTRDRANTQCGTPLIWPPEVIRGKPYGKKADIWALGILLYKMATFSSPWDAVDYGELTEKVQECKYPELPNCYSEGLKKVLQMCLQKSASARGTIRELLNTPLLIARAREFLTDQSFRSAWISTITSNQIAHAHRASRTIANAQQSDAFFFDENEYSSAAEERLRVELEGLNLV